MRSPREELFFVRGIATEMLGLQVASPRPGSNIDTPALGPIESLAYLRYEILRRAPRPHKDAVYAGFLQKTMPVRQVQVQVARTASRRVRLPNESCGDPPESLSRRRGPS